MSRSFIPLLIGLFLVPFSSFALDEKCLLALGVNVPAGEKATSEAADPIPSVVEAVEKKPLSPVSIVLDTNLANSFILSSVYPSDIFSPTFQKLRDCGVNEDEVDDIIAKPKIGEKYVQSGCISNDDLHIIRIHRGIHINGLSDRMWGLRHYLYRRGPNLFKIEHWEKYLKPQEDELFRSYKGNLDLRFPRTVFEESLHGDARQKMASDSSASKRLVSEQKGFATSFDALKPNHQEFLKMLEDYGIGKGQKNGHNDRRIIAEVFYALREDGDQPPILVTADRDIAYGLAKISSSQILENPAIALNSRQRRELHIDAYWSRIRNGEVINSEFYMATTNGIQKQRILEIYANIRAPDGTSNNIIVLYFMTIPG